MTKGVTSHTFRHSFAKQLFADDYDLRMVQGLLGRTDVRKTMIYTHVLNRGGTRFAQSGGRAGPRRRER